MGRWPVVLSFAPVLPPRGEPPASRHSGALLLFVRRRQDAAKAAAHGFLVRAQGAIIIVAVKGTAFEQLLVSGGVIETPFPEVAQDIKQTKLIRSAGMAYRRRSPAGQSSARHILDLLAAGKFFPLLFGGQRVGNAGGQGPLLQRGELASKLDGFKPSDLLDRLQVPKPIGMARIDVHDTFVFALGHLKLAYPQAGGKLNQNHPDGIGHLMGGPGGGGDPAWRSGFRWNRG